MATTLKLKLASKSDAGSGQTRLVFQADYDDEKNKEWAKYTPVLNLDFVVLNEVSVAQHEVGTTYTATLEES